MVRIGPAAPPDATLPWTDLHAVFAEHARTGFAGWNPVN
jgi:hypothetical protein